MTGYSRLVRPALFRLGRGDPEAGHEATLRVLARLGPVLPARPFTPPGAARTVFGVRFPNPVGLAAGMDKDGRALAAWPALGFGFVEVGTVTWLPQPGNPRPRLFRLPASRALVNRMGFNNAGAAALAARLAAPGRRPVPLGVSIGKSAAVPLDDAVDDYLRSLRVLAPHADYLAVNVSSPNTPGLRSLQHRAQLDTLLDTLVSAAADVAGPAGSVAGPPDGPGPAGSVAGPPGGAGSPAGRRRSVPILVKVAPDLSDRQLAEVLEVCLGRGVAGVIATNTTLSRAGVAGPDAALAGQAGGLSGAPLAARAREVVRFVVERTGGALPVIGVGGVMSPDDARRLVDAGASLVQLYTGLVYQGPGLVRGCVRALARPGARRPGVPSAR